MLTGGLEVSFSIDNYDKIAIFKFFVKQLYMNVLYNGYIVQCILSFHAFKISFELLLYETFYFGTNVIFSCTDIILKFM